MPPPTTSNNNHAVSAYAPIRRNSFLQDPIQPTSVSSRLPTVTVGLTLIAIRFWKDARLWQEIVARLPRQWQVVLTTHLQKWPSVLQRVVRKLLQSLQEQLTPFLIQPHHNKRDAPTSILCDGSSSTGWTENHHQWYEDRIRQNQALIQKVLHYWFGQSDPDQAQKKLWMIANSSGDWRQTVDAEITDLFAPLLLELAIACKEEEAKKQPCRWQQWCADKDLYGFPGKLAAIIVLDQFSRHIRRHQEESTAPQPQQSTIVPLPPQSQLDALALRTARLLTEGHAQEIDCGMIPLPQYIFGLMPYRHASTLEAVQYVQTCVERAASLQWQLEGMTNRFRKATNRRLAVLQDQARRTGQPATSTDAEATTTGNPKEDDPPTITQFSDEDILETFPFEADMTDAADHPVVKTIQSFLADRGIHPVTPGGLQTNKNKKKQTKKNKKKGQTKKNNPQPQKAPPPSDTNKQKPPPPPCSVIVSLSGGVDSMAIASVLAYLKTHQNYPHLKLMAIHIDYANRPESQAESDYVESYCKRLGFDDFTVRRIDEITRGITARDEYEQRARQMRYDMYRSAVAACKEQQQSSTVGVMLGHHRGDLRENVLSNAHKGCGPLDLSGMTAVSQNDGVTIFRPLLPLEKTEVYDYAHRYGVPYFKDTTPHWSTRGKLRNKLLPLLEEIYGEGSMNNLSTLATESDECRNLLDKVLLRPFMDSVVRTPMGITFETAPFVAQGLFFWKFVLREVLHSAGLGMFSDKSVVSFLERIRPTHTFKKTIREGWLQCRRDYAVYLQQDGKIFVFYPDSLPWRKSDAFQCQGEVFDMKKQYKNLAAGPWIIEAEQCELKDEDKTDMVKRKAVTSMTDFMDGVVEYYLEVPTIREEKVEDREVYIPMSLIFAPAFRKETRPPAWKNTDEKLQEILPLLGLSEEASQELKHPTTDNPVAIVRITLDRRFTSDPS